MRRISILMAAALFCAGVFCANAATKVACVGNSITYGMKIPDREKSCYPAQLQRMLGSDYEVGNFGHSGATLLNRGHNPYMKLPEFRQALDFKPDIVLIHLGVNDTDPRDWPDFNDGFVRDYLALIDSFKVVNPAARVILANISPVNATHKRFKSGTREWRHQVRDAVERVALASGSELIDFETPLNDRRHLLPDGLHPNAEGASLLALTAYSAITGNYQGLSMAPIYQSEMVLQRDKPLRIGGTANAGERVTLTLGGESYSAVADNCGRWDVVTLPLVTGPSYEMVVTAGGKTLRFTDILAGEVWLASGQSNMEFTLGQSTGGKDEAARANDPNLRFYDAKRAFHIDSRWYTDSIMDRVNHLDFFKTAKWQGVTPANAGQFSAVAYYFAKQLRDSLDVPVGIICNAVGGAPTESWIGISALEEEIPEILIDWKNNDYVQKWVQDRAKDKECIRHPYDPSYLFSAGIVPLDSYPIEGVIWYQGESNAHNIEVHERLFPLLVSNWREYFRDASMPFYFVQLSSLNRPSWPQFRDSQRRMAGRIPGVAMAVSSDYGDSLDVHPKNKRPVGERLALLALRDTYGRDIVASGPEPVKAENHGSSIALTFANGAGMRPAAGDELVGFEVAEIDGLYYPATARVENDSVIVVSSDKVKRPILARYGWQPFTRANLVNSNGLPASTFRIEVSNVGAPEEGYEYGVSAPFAGRLAGRLIIAGGCNFPEKPFAPASLKRFYKGIYASDTSAVGGELTRIGELPAPVAYGASARVADGLVLIGGLADGNPSKAVYLLKINGPGTELCRLPSLPAAIDNMAAAAVGNVVYVAGGNIDGVPGNCLFALDLGNAGDGWQRLRDFPGNPRTQPVMAAVDGKLFLWGGFAPLRDVGKKHRRATLETDGLRYDPAKDKWSKLPAPMDEEGRPVSIGGGAALALSDGRIAVAGGVNKDIFLKALNGTPADYLSHPADWYRFNDRIFVFDTAASSWHIAERSGDAARAGAALVDGEGNSFYLVGGEVKPRVRTSRITRYDIK